jgi:hypothetical protein
MVPGVEIPQAGIDISSGTPADFLPESSSIPGANPARGEWIARIVLLGVAGALAWFTWGHWGDFQIDCGREIYVPVAILHGKLLFRDIWYMYGPLAPYVQAFLFRIFGIHLMVLYFFGLTLAMGSALFAFEIGRQFEMGPIPAMVAPLLLLSEAFSPFIFNVVFPYSYAASLGLFLGMAFAFYAVRHSRQKRWADLALAALLASLALLAKQEFGVACLATLGFEVCGWLWIDRSWRACRKNLLVCLAGLSPALAVYGWFTWKLSAKAVFFDNWISTPGTFFMKTYGKFMVPAQGLRFVPREALQTVGMALAAIALWYGIAAINVFGVKKLKSQPRHALMVLLLDLLLAVVTVFGARDWARTLHTFLREAIFPHGLFFVGIFFILQAIWRLWRSPAARLVLPETVLGIFAALISGRIMMRLTPSAYSYSVFFNVPLFLIFVILLVRIGRWAGRSLELRSRHVFVAYLLGAQAALLVILLIPNPYRLPAPLTTDLGTFYTRRDVTILFPQIITFMKNHTRNGKDILVMPEPPSLYVFAGMQAPTRWYSQLPGMVDPDHEQEFIREATSNDVRYVLISNRAMPEYGLTTFGHGYDEAIFHWVAANYNKIGQFGPLPNSFPNPYVMNIFERKDIQGAH